jgi:hypothetical protein
MMQTLVIEATTHDSGQALDSLLSSFDPELFNGEDGRHDMSIGLVSDRQVVDVLDAIQRYLTDQALHSLISSLRVVLDGRAYTLYA